MRGSKIDLFFKNSHDIFDYLVSIVINHVPEIFDESAELKNYTDLTQFFEGNEKIKSWLSAACSEIDGLISEDDATQMTSWDDFKRYLTKNIGGIDISNIDAESEWSNGPLHDDLKQFSTYSGSVLIAGSRGSGKS